MAGDLLDRTWLSRLKEVIGDAEFASIVAEFMSDSAALLEDMNAAMLVGDADALMRAAHTFKSTSTLLGAAQLTEVCAILESSSADGDLSEASARVRSATELFLAAKEALVQLADG